MSFRICINLQGVEFLFPDRKTSITSSKENLKT